MKTVFSSVTAQCLTYVKKYFVIYSKEGVYEVHQVHKVSYTISGVYF